MAALNVSNCTNITAADLKNVTDIESNLRILYALEMPQIPLEPILSLLKSPSNKIDQIYHTALFQKALQVFPKDRKDLTQDPQSDNPAMANPVDQLILVKALQKAQNFPEKNAREYFDWRAFEFCEENMYNHCVVCPFGDLPLQATSLLRWPLKLPVLKPNHWSVILIHEYLVGRDEENSIKPRYAIVSPVEEGPSNGALPKFRVIDMETFLEEVMADQDRDNLATFWAGHGATLTAKIGEQEVHELMPVVKGNLNGAPDFWPYDMAT
ncbi:MAG: hypothetical protein Q9195_001213 [Heterodermia aff. obscurata]